MSAAQHGPAGPDAVRQCAGQAFRQRRSSGMSAPRRRGDTPVGGARPPEAIRARRAVDRRRPVLLRRARRARNVGACVLGSSHRSRLRAGQRPAHGGWRHRDSCWDPFPRPGARNHLCSGRALAGKGSVTLREVARAWYLQPQNLPPDVDTGGLEVTAGYRADRDSGTFSYATHAAVVAVDPQTGLIELLDYVVVEDGGILVNPMIVDGQVCGGTAQGIGTCLYEAMPFDAQGQPLASTMLDYMLPGPTEVPDIRVLHMETPSPYTEFGMKGLGEGGAVGPPAAIVSAVNDALRPLGAEVHDLPLTPEGILAAIDAASARTPNG